MGVSLIVAFLFRHIIVEGFGITTNKMIFYCSTLSSVNRMNLGVTLIATFFFLKFQYGVDFSSQFEVL